jgi:acyl-CoA dehydrogenase
MDFALTGDQVLIRDSAETVLAEISDSAAVRAAMETSIGYEPAVWARLAGELGWCATGIPERCGGLGLGPVENALLLEQMGRRLLCAPFFSTVCLAANLLLEAGSASACERYLPRIAAGELRATATLGEVPVRARRGDGGWVLDGSLRKVLDGATADVLFVLAQVAGEGAPGLFAVRADTAALTRTALKTWDLTRRFASVELRGVTVADTDRLDDPERAATGFARAEALAMLGLAAEQLGCAQQCLDLTLAYVANRKQFGRVIASFQAVKHRCAEMMVRVEATRSMVYGAAAFAAGAPSVEALANECAAAKALASETAFWCAQEAIQLHGGVGFAWEYDPHLYFKRAQAAGQWLGVADSLRETIAASLLDTGIAA